MAPYVPEEVDVFSIPHSRMKELVHKYFEMMQSTNFSNMIDLELLLESLSRTFTEFRSHEKIENKLIMKRLKSKLKKLSIQNTAVCNCHKDNNLKAMLQLVRDGYRKKTALDRLNYGLQLQKALEEFTNTFLPHMKEEEEVFQPLLLQHFSYEELCELKQKVIEQHLREKGLEKSSRADSEQQAGSSDSEEDELKARQADTWGRREPRKTLPLTPDVTSSVTEGPSSRAVSDLPPELLLRVFSHLSPRDLCRTSRVCRTWSRLSFDQSLWKNILPIQWARGDWSFHDNSPDDDDTSEDGFLGDEDSYITLDDDADVDESVDDGYAEVVQQVKREASILLGLSQFVLPRVGGAAQRLVLANSRTLSNGLLQRILYLCPNVEHLDLSQTKVTDSGLNRLGKAHCGSCLNTLILSGCVNISDATLVRLAMALTILHSPYSGAAAGHQGNGRHGDDSGSNPKPNNDVSLREETDNECLCEEYFKVVGKKIPDGCDVTAQNGVCWPRNMTQCQVCENIGDNEDKDGKDNEKSPARDTATRVKSPPGELLVATGGCHGNAGCCHDNAGTSQCPANSAIPSDFGVPSMQTCVDCRRSTVCTKGKNGTLFCRDCVNPKETASPGVAPSPADGSRQSTDEPNYRDRSYEVTMATRLGREPLWHGDDPSNVPRGGPSVEAPRDSETGRLPRDPANDGNKVKWEQQAGEPANRTAPAPCHDCCGMVSAATDECQAVENCLPARPDRPRDSDPSGGGGGGGSGEGGARRVSGQPALPIALGAVGEFIPGERGGRVPVTIKLKRKERNLHLLNLSGCFQVTDIGIRALAGAGYYPRLSVIDLSGCFRVTAGALHALVAGCPALEPAQLYYCDNILGGPHADTASGCRNLQCNSRACCRSGD